MRCQLSDDTLDDDVSLDGQIVLTNDAMNDGMD
jgi:hypothetical protein